MMVHADLDHAWWSNGTCIHENASMSLYGTCAAVGCSECGARMTFLMKFRRPKRFEVEISNNGKDSRHVGYASARATARFLADAASITFVPEEGADPAGKTPVRDAAMLGILMSVLEPKMPGPRMPLDPARDFAAAWQNIDCEHRTVSCQAYGKTISMECRDCATDLSFDIVGDSFDVRMMRMPLEPESYGQHDAGAAIAIIRKYAKTLEMPGMMADRMSGDPDLDARRIGRLMQLLERYGLVKPMAADTRDNLELIAYLSAMHHDRATFEERADMIEPMLRAKGWYVTERGKRVGVRRGLEMIRLAWPYAFEGLEIEIDAYDVTGISEFCARCGFSTLDDPDVGTDHWERGCPECGYGGFLLDMDARGYPAAEDGKSKISTQERD